MTSAERENIRHYEVTLDGAPIDDDMQNRLAEIEVSLAFNMPGMFTLRFEDDELSILGQNKIELGKEVEISLTQDDNAETLTSIFKGEITAIEPEYEYGLRTIVNVRGYDFSHRLTHGTQIRTFLNTKDSDIVSTIAGEVGLSPQIEATSTVYDHIMQYNQTNMDFLRQLARRNNYKFFVDQGKKLHFKKAATEIGSEVTLTWGENLLGFFPRLSLTEQVTEVTVRGWDVKNKEAIVGQARNATYLQEIGAQQKGGVAYNTATSKDAKHYEVTHMALDQSQADDLAQAVLDELNADYVEADGLSKGNMNLVPGGKVEIKSVNDQFAGKYKLSMVRHIYSREGLKTEFTVEGMRPEFMSSLLGNSAEKVLTNQLVHGVVPAIVTNTDDPDGLHRVKVKYPWLTDDEESWWARVAAPDAGPERGITFMPEVDDEVLVAFEHGDMGRPYVVGRLWNGRDAIPHTQSELVSSGATNLRVIKTRSGHTLTFDDTDGAELISIIDTTGSNLIKIDSSANTITIDANGKGKIVMNGQSGTLDITSTGNMTLDAGTGNVEIKGNNVTITANMKAAMSGNSGTDVTSSAIVKVQGSLVNIN